MRDLIDRQAAISYAISGRIRTLPTSEDGENWIRTSEVRQSLLTMPSAQPELIERTAYIRGFEQGRTQGMIDAQGEKNMIKAEWTNADALDLQPTCNQLATDCISRQAAIDDIKAMYEWHDVVTEDRLIEHIKRLPSAQPERKAGKWMRHPAYKYDNDFREWDICSVCGIGCRRREYGINPNGTEYETIYGYSYCPNCGAKMQLSFKGATFEDIDATLEKIKTTFGGE